MKRGVSRGPIGVWEGGPLSLAQSDTGQLITSSRADTYVSNAVSRPQEWDTAPLHRAWLFHRVYGVGGHHKTTTLITVVLAASAATAAVVYREVVDGKENISECVIVLLTSVGDRGLRKECAQRILSALSTQASPNQCCQF